MRVRRVDTSAWPTVKILVAAPGTDAAAAEFTLKEKPGGPAIAASSLTEVSPRLNQASTVIALDTSRSLSPAHLEAARNALTKFVAELDAGEQVAVLAFNDTVELADGFTKDRDALTAALSQLKLGGQKTELYRAMLSGVDLLKNIPGRRALLVITDGKDEGAGITAGQVEGAAEQNNVAISVIGLPGLRGNDSELYLPLMRQFAEDTGGLYRMADSPESLEDAVYSLLVDHRGMPGGMYELAFTMADAPLPSSGTNAELTRTHDGATQTALISLNAPQSAQPAPSAVPDTPVPPAAPLSATARDAAPDRTAQSPASREPAGTTVDQPGSASATSSAGPVAQPAPVNAPPIVQPREAENAIAHFWWIIPLLLLLWLAYRWFKRGARTPGQSQSNTLQNSGNGLLVLYFLELDKSFPLKPGTMILGSGETNDMSINAPGIAEVHAEFCVGDECIMRGLGNSRGITLNGEPVTKPAKLRVGDELRFGSTRAVVKDRLIK